MSGLAKCPECGKLISLRFPLHVCEPTETEAKVKCQVCKKPIERPGLDGVTFGRAGVHDACANITRDAFGYIWTPEDIKRGYIVLTDVSTGQKTQWKYRPAQVQP